MQNFKLKIIGNDSEYIIDKNLSVLESALNNNIVIPYGCKNGQCGSCRGQVVDGKVTSSINIPPYIISPIDQEKGWTLFCQAKPESDLTIKVRTLAKGDAIEIKKYPGRVQSLDFPNKDTAILKIKIPSSVNFKFNPGQYIDILLKDQKRRSYSLANSNGSDENIELHLKNMGNGTFTNHVFNSMKVNEILRFEGPLGGFKFAQDNNKNIVFLASGTGFAPIKSIINSIDFQVDHNYFLYWGVRYKKDFYDESTTKFWKENLTNFKFIPVVSDEPSEFKNGFVHKAVLEDHPNLENFSIYACGSPLMVEAARAEFIKNHKLSEDQFFSDAFLPAIDNN